MSTHNIIFHGEIGKIFTRYPSLSRPMIIIKHSAVSLRWYFVIVIVICIICIKLFFFFFSVLCFEPEDFDLLHWITSIGMYMMWCTKQENGPYANSQGPYQPAHSCCLKHPGGRVLTARITRSLISINWRRNSANCMALYCTVSFFFFTPWLSQEDLTLPR